MSLRRFQKQASPTSFQPDLNGVGLTEWIEGVRTKISDDVRAAWTGNGFATPQSSIFSNRASINPGSAECSNAFRFGATYCARSANILARNSTGFVLFIAIRAMPAMGSHRIAANFSTTSWVRLFGTPR
jgi:hypothetical protein